MRYLQAKERTGHWDLFCHTQRHSSSLTDAGTYGRPKQQPSFLRSDVFPLSQLLGVALSPPKKDDNKSTLNRLLRSNPCQAAFKETAEKSHFTTLPVIPGPFVLTFKILTLKQIDCISKVYILSVFQPM